MKISKIPGMGRFGHFVDDVDWENITDEEWMDLGRLHLEGLVTIFRNVPIHYDRYNELMCKWGSPRYPRPVNFYLKYGKSVKELVSQNLLDDGDKQALANARKWLVDKRLQLVRVTSKKNSRGENMGIFGDGELKWHSNACADISFAPGVSLMGWESMIGSCTSFLTTPDYYESLSESFRSELDQMVVVHNYKTAMVNPETVDDQESFYRENQCPRPDMKVPLIIKSPGGIKGIHLGVTAFDRIEGMSQEESTRLFERLQKELFVEEYIYDHWYQSDRDICVFDNSITLHRRLIKDNGHLPDRVGLRLQFDYDKLAGDYVPYYQDEFNRERAEQIALNDIALEGIVASGY